MGTGTKKADLWRNPYPCHGYGFSWVQVQKSRPMEKPIPMPQVWVQVWSKVPMGYPCSSLPIPCVRYPMCQISPVPGITCVRYPVCHLYNINSYCILSPPTTFSIPLISSYTIDHSLLYISLYHILSYSAYHPILHIVPYYISPPICISITYCIQYLILLNICPHIHIVYHFYPHITYQHTNLLYIIYILYSSPTFF